MNFNGKTAIVTGGSRGIGKAIAEVFAQRGSQVVIADISLERAQQTASEIASAYGIKAVAFPVNVASFESCKELVEKINSEFTKIDILVNNAGVTRDNLIMRMEEQDFEFVIDINLKGVWNCSKAVIRTMMKQRSGRIINISSVSGLAGQAGQTNYSASKAGVIGLTKALAREVASRNITVNAVAPGFIPTALTNELPEELKDAMIKLTPLGRWGSPEEVAYAVAFFASDEAAYITGQVLSVDGGMMMM